MKKFFIINDTTANKISYYHIMVMLVVLPFDQFYSHIVFASFALHTLIHLKKDDLKALLNPKVWLLPSVFFITLISCIYSSYPIATDITRQLAILLFPVFFSLNTLNINKYRNNLLFIFSMVCTATIAYLYAHAFITIHYFGLPFITIFSNSFISHNFSFPVGMHATFLSLQITIALFFLLSQLINRRQPVFICLILIGLLFAGIVQLGSKAVLIVVLLSVNVAVPYFLITTKHRLKYILITAMLSATVIFGAINMSAFRARYVTDLKNDLSATKPDEAVEPRLVRWEAAIDLIKKSPVIGYGAGSELSILQDKYYSKKLYSAFLNKLNAHNQYLTFLLVTGIIGLLVYTLTLVYGFGISLRQRDIMLFVFILLIATVSLSESLLNAEKGIWFYALFFSFFTFSQAPSPDKKID